MLKKIRQYLEFCIIVAIVKLAQILPTALLRAFGNGLGTFVYYCVPIRKKHAIKSLHEAFPQKNSSEVHSIVRKLYQNLGKILVNYNFFPDPNPQELVDNYIVEGEAILKQALSENKGVIIASGHLGDWEGLTIMGPAFGYDLSVVVAPIRNPYLNKLVTHCRARSGVRLISKKGMAIRHITKDLKENRCVGMLMDQDAGKSGVFVDFFGRPASTPQGPAQFALKRGVPIVMAFSFPQNDGRLKLIIEEIALPHDQENFVQDVTQKVTSRLEYYIRKHPEQWFGWLHRRWKTKPPA